MVTCHSGKELLLECMKVSNVMFVHFHFACNIEQL